MNGSMYLKIHVVKITGRCPVYQEDAAFYLKDGYIIDTSVSCAICMHSLASILPYYNAIHHGADPVTLGLAQESERPARVQCLDPCG